MIQRIQSVYLLITAILMAVTVCSPLVALQGNESNIFIFKCLGIYKEAFAPSYWTWGVISTAALAALLSFINIFLFKKRKIQIKLCNITTLLIIVFYIAFAIYLYFGMNALNTEFSGLKYGIILPAIALIFNILATTKIKADEKLVQSLNRIR